ncbi:MAG: extracellular solute-binding protein [Lachnospiraceae bacterium]|nr:extracellular solute-binding protein [Lachnospiraceae bacterium]
MNKNLVLKLLTTLCLLSLISGCGSKSGTSISILYTASDGEYVHNVAGADIPFETLEEAEAKGKTILWMQNTSGKDVVSFAADAFNCKNEKYHVEIQTFEAEEWDEARQRLKAELTAGKGPDLITRGILNDASKIMKKGCFVDLAPLLAASGFTDDMFFSSYKCLEDKEHIYGVSIEGNVVGMAVKKDVIGGKELPSFEEFVDDVLYYPGNAIFRTETQKPWRILEYFLGCSETLWGCVDWNNMTCDFNTELFSKILDIAKRYNDARGKGYSPITKVRFMMPSTAESEEYYEKNGWVTVDMWFDDGNYPENNESSETVMINSNTKNLEGAWAFVAYYLSASGQSYESVPTNRELYDVFYEDLRERIGPERAAETCPQSAVDIYKDLLERGRFAPYKTEPILDIIYEEADSYISGDKEKSEVINLIQSRVSLYLAEIQ